MTIGRVTELARADNPTLAWLCKTWIESRRKDPVSIAEKINRWRFCLGVEIFLVGAFIISYGVVRTFVPEAGPVALANLGISAAVAILTVPTAIKLSRENHTEVRQFCRAISMLEESCCCSLPTGVAQTVWDIGYDPKNGNIDADVQKLLSAADVALAYEARKVRAVEGFPWKEAERRNLRDDFTSKMSSLSCLLGKRFETKKYF